MGKKEEKELFDRMRALENNNAIIIKTLESVEKNTSSFEKKFSEHDDKEMAKYDIYDTHQQELTKNIITLTTKVDAFTIKVDNSLNETKKLDAKVDEHKTNTDGKITKLEQDMIKGFGDINTKLESIWGKLKSFGLIASLIILFLGGGWSVFTYIDQKNINEKQMLLNKIEALEKPKKEYTDEEKAEYYKMMSDRYNKSKG